MSDQRLTPREAELILRLVNKCVDLNGNVQERAKRSMGLANDYGSASEIHELARAVPKLMAISSGPDHDEPVAVGQVYRGNKTGLQFDVVSTSAKMAHIQGDHGAVYRIRFDTLLRDYKRVR